MQNPIPGKSQSPAAPAGAKSAPGKKSRHYTIQSLPSIHPDAAGADIGAREIVVCVPAGRAEQTVRTFLTFTEDLHALADWLQECRVSTIAVESTGMFPGSSNGRLNSATNGRGFKRYG